MAISFPTSLDALTNPSSTTALNDGTIPHHQQHGDANDAIEALEAKVGIDGSADTVSLDYKTANLGAGTYTPTLTGVANVGASGALACQYMRVRDVVTVSGRLTLDPTAAVATQLGISLPVASNLANAEECAGTAVAPGIAGQCAAIVGDATNNRAELQYVAADLTNQAWSFTFTYRVIA